MDGILLVNKEKGMSSHDVISSLRKILKTKKIGHCGTLDPSATGVLVCLINKATKLSNYLVLDDKEYIATFKLGQATTTQDLEGEIVASKEYKYEYSTVDIENILHMFVGKITQIPSIYSAIKVNGRKLYEYARANEEVEIPSRNITIHNIELLNFAKDLITIKVNCSSGTYIRTLCYDIAKKLGYPGVLTELTRTKSGKYCIENSYSLNEIQESNFEIISLLNALSDYEIEYIDNDMLKDVKNGKVLKSEKQQPFIVVCDNTVQALYSGAIDGYAKIIRGLW